MSSPRSADPSLRPRSPSSGQPSEIPHVYSAIPTYRDRLPELTEQLKAHGHLGLVLVDASQLAQVEHDYGSKAFEQVLVTIMLGHLSSNSTADGPSVNS